MKTKNLSLLAGAVLLAFASCTDEVQELATQQQELKQIVMTTEDFQSETGSRTLYQIADGAVRCTWVANDTVGVFPDEGMQTAFPMASGAGTKNATFDGKGWALKDGRTYGAYYPFIGKMYLDKESIPVSYTGQTQTGNGSMAHLGAYDYMASAPVAPEFGSAKFVFRHLSSLVQLKLTVPEPATITSVKLVTDAEAFAVEGTVDIMAEVPGIASKTLTSEVELKLQDVATTEADEVVTLYMMLPPADLSEQTLKAVVASDKGTQVIELESKNFQAGKAYALSGEMEVTELGYKDGVVTLSEAGTLKQFLGDNCFDVTSLKIVGPINGTDVLCLRQMLGGYEFRDDEKGVLAALDLSDASIVKGGSSYYAYHGYYYTSNDVIGGCMFVRCVNLKSIVLPNSVTSIRSNAFDGCSSLTSIGIPAGVTTIGSNAFSGCTSLTSIDIPDGVTSIGSGAFYCCSSLTSIDIPDGVTSIGNWTFAGCTSLTSIDILDSVTSIGNSAFSGCYSLKSVYITDLSAWCKIAFDGYFSNPLENGAKLYLNNQELTELVMPEDITEIKNYTFYNCKSIIQVTIGAGVTSIGEYAFSGCSSLKSVYITDLSAWCKIAFNDNVSNPLYNGARLYLNNEELTELAIPADIKRIRDYTFYGYTSLTKVSMHDDVTYIGIAAFRGCSALASVNIPAAVTSIGKEAFHSCKSLAQVYCYATTPPTINTTASYSSFDATGSKTLHVPTGCSTAYQSSAWGTYFPTIKEME